MTTQAPTPVHKAVQEHYGNLAKEAGSCCEISDGAKPAQNVLYPEELLAGLPSDIANFTAGSGDPISLAELKPGETALDLGSGGGLDCFLAAKQVGESGHVIGVDMTPEMLARARSSAARLNYQNVEFREGFLEDLPVDDNSVDVIISNCVINLSPDKPQVLREMFRTLKPGGRIAISDVVTNHPVPEQALKGNEDWCGCTSGALPYQTYISELEKAGFADIRLEPNLELIETARQRGEIRVESNRIPSKEEVLDHLRNWEKIEANLFVPHKISARKPG
jgi:SAM-dependent methyltransferase